MLFETILSLFPSTYLHNLLHERKQLCGYFGVGYFLKNNIFVFAKFFDYIKRKLQH